MNFFSAKIVFFSFFENCFLSFNQVEVVMLSPMLSSNDKLNRFIPTAQLNSVRVNSELHLFTQFGARSSVLIPTARLQ